MRRGVKSITALSSVWAESEEGIPDVYKESPDVTVRAWGWGQGCINT